MLNKYQLKIQEISVEISVYDDNIFKIKLGDKEVNKSKAILPQKFYESEYKKSRNGFSVSTDSVTLTADDGTICFADKNGNVILKTYPDSMYNEDENGGFSLSFSLTENEHIYGLGEDNDADFGRLDRRGTVRDMITGQRINKNRVTADFPIPFILSAGGNAPYGLYIENTYNLTVDIGKSVADRLTVSSIGGACEFIFIAGDSAETVVKDFSLLTGRAKLPPLWALGYIQSKCSFWDWEEIDDAIASFTDNNIPIDCIVFDFDWAQHFNNYKWADRWEGKSAEKIKYYAEKYGIHFMASNSGPMLKRDSDTFDDALKNGVLATDTQGNTVTCGHYSGELIDFTNPVAEQWHDSQIRGVMNDGIESWWLDLTEPEGEADNTVYHLGIKAEIHNIFSNCCSEAYHNIMKRAYPGKRSFVLTRTGTAGIQRNPTALWTGDIFSDYGTLQAHIPEALNTCLSGISMWTCDTGGFLSPTNNSECPYNLYHNDLAEHSQLFERWSQFSCFTPVFRSHHAGGESVPHRFNELTNDGIARYIKLRYRLIPYIYSLYYENYLDGTPIMRPLFWHYPDDEKAYTIKDQYLFGENVLVAPVLTDKTSERTVYLPDGTWYDYDYGYQYSGGEHEVYAPQNRIPIFIKAGAIIPMSKPVVNTKDIDFSDIELLIYPDRRSEFSMYADDGITDNYQNGEYTKTVFSCEKTESGIKLLVNSNNEKFAVKTVTVHVRMDKKPEKLLIDGKDVKLTSRENTVRKSNGDIYCFDEFNRMLHAKLDVNGNAEIEILTGDTMYQPVVPFSEKQLSGQLPFIYPAATVPCKLEAVHYDRGGEGVAYHKLTENEASDIRPDNAGISKDRNGYILSLTAGEWTEYTLSVNGSSDYRVVVDGDTDNAEIEVGAGRGTVKLENGTAVIPIENGEPVLKVEVLRGNALLRQIRIEATR